MQILITGGAGFIGSHLAERLLADGHAITIVDDLSTGRFQNIEHLVKNKKFKFAIESILNESLMDRLIAECDWVYHLAAGVGVDLIITQNVKVIETNINGTDVILRLASRYRKKTFIASTSEVYGKSENVPFSEDHDITIGPTFKSRWSYACSKAIDEFIALAYYKERNLPVVIGRLFNTVGPRQTGRYGMVVPRFVKQSLNNEDITVYGDGNQSRCFCHVSEVVGALKKLMETDAAEGEVINIGNNIEISILELARKVKDRTGSTAKIVTIPYENAYPPGFEDMIRRIPNIEKINRLIGFKPVKSIEDIVDDVIRFQKSFKQY
jgi:UDP-glucose 4-epimerase